VEVSLEAASFKGSWLEWLGGAGGMFVGGLIVWHGLRRYVAILREADRLASQSTCAACKVYARFDVLGELAKFPVRCRNCSHEWTIA
jgi:hypothetical protein